MSLNQAVLWGNSVNLHSRPCCPISGVVPAPCDLWSICSYAVLLFHSLEICPYCPSKTIRCQSLQKPGWWEQALVQEGFSLVSDVTTVPIKMHTDMARTTSVSRFLKIPIFLDLTQAGGSKLHLNRYTRMTAYKLKSLTRAICKINLLVVSPCGTKWYYKSEA